MARVSERTTGGRGLEPIGLPDVNSSEQPNLWRLLDETLAEVYETIDPPEIGSALH
jgi:hypothetical protein